MPPTAIESRKSRSVHISVSLTMVFMLIWTTIFSPAHAQNNNAEAPGATPIVEAVPADLELTETPSATIDDSGQPEQDLSEMETTEPTDVVDLPIEEGNEPTDGDSAPSHPTSPSESERPDEDDSSMDENSSHVNPAQQIVTPSSTDEGTPTTELLQPTTTGNVVTAASKTYPRLGYVQFSGSGFTPGTQIEMRWDPPGTNELYTARADEYGTFVIGMTIPNSADDGVYTVLFMEVSGTWTSTLELTVEGGPTPLISVNPASGAAGDQIVVVGSWFRPYETVAIHYQTETGTILGTFDAYEDGGLWATINIPESATSGDNTFWAVGDRGQKTSFTINVYSSESPIFILTPTSGHPNYLIGFSGRFYEPNEEVAIHLGSENGTTITTTYANRNGEISGTFQIPNALANTTYTIFAVGSSDSAQSEFTTDASTPLESSVSPGTVERGETVTITGSGYPANQSVNIFLGQIGWLPDQSVNADSSGAFTIGLQIPTTSALGSMDIYVADYRGFYSKSTIQVDPATETLEVDPATGYEGDEINFIGRNFYPDEEITISLDTVEVATVTANRDGEISGIVTIPKGTLTNSINLVASGTSGKSATASITVLHRAELVISPESGLAGSTLSIVSTGFSPNELVTIRIADIEIAEVSADSNGDIEIDVIVPVQLPIGLHTVTVDGTSGLHAELEFEITGPSIITIATEPKAGLAGSTFTISTAGFQPGELITFRIAGYNGQILGYAYASADGKATLSAMIPTQTPTANRWISAEGTSGRRNAVLFEITGPPVITIATEPKSGLAGSTFSISTAGFQPSELITFRIAGYNGQILGYAYAGDDGKATLSAMIPTQTPTANRWISAEGTSGRRNAVLFEITGPPVITIATEPKSDLAGSTFTISTAGFQPGELITFRISGYNGHILGNAHAGDDGKATLSAMIPTQTPTANRWISAEGTSGRRNAVLFEITGPPVITIATDPTSGLAGSTFTISTAGFQPGELITFRISGYNGHILGNAHAGDDGKATLSAMIPTQTPTANRWISAEGTSGRRNAVLFEITGPPVITIATDPTSGLAGSTFTISTTGFQPGELITFRISGYNGHILGNAHAGDDGKATLSAMIPTQTPTANRWITAEGTSGRRNAVLFEITGPPAIEIYVSPTSGRANSDVYFSASGFQPNELVTIRYGGYNGTILSTVRATSYGYASDTVTIPYTARTQSYWLSAEGTSGARNATLFAVTGPPLIKISISPISGRANSDVYISASGFQPNELVNFRFSGYNGIYLGQARAAANGEVYLETKVPANMQPVNHWVTAEGTSGARDAVLFKVFTVWWSAPPVDYNCSDFPTQAEAQAYFDMYPGDPSGLDANKNGIACESNP